MQNKQDLLTYAYHFLTEALLIFLLFVPLLRYQYDVVPYWEYLILALGICLLYTIFLNYLNRYVYYIIAAPLIGLLFYFLEYPMFISIAFATLLTWRSIQLRNGGFVHLNKENKYMLTICLVSFFLYVGVRDIEIIIYACLLLIILFAGYVSSHLVVIQKEERKQVDKKLPLYILGTLIVGVVAVFPIFTVGRYLIKKLWEGFTFLFIFIASRAVWLIESLGLKLESNSSEEEGAVLERGGQEFVEETEPLIDQAAPYFYWGMIIIVLMMLSFIVIRLLRKRFYEPVEEEASEQVTYVKLDDGKRASQNRFAHFLKNLFNRPTDPARKLMYTFERNMIGTDHERQSFETVDQWSKRIGLPTNLEAYQKVRYGEQAISQEEIDDLKEQLATFNENQRVN